MTKTVDETWKFANGCLVRFKDMDSLNATAEIHLKSYGHTGEIKFIMVSAIKDFRKALDEFKLIDESLAGWEERKKIKLDSLAGK